MSLHTKLERVEEALRELMKAREVVKSKGEKLVKACDEFRSVAEEMYLDRWNELEEKGYTESEMEGDKRTRLLQKMAEGENALSPDGGDEETLWSYDVWREATGGIRRDISINRKMLEDMQSSNKWPTKGRRSEKELLEESIEEDEKYENEAYAEKDEPDDVQPEDSEV